MHFIRDYGRWFECCPCKCNLNRSTVTADCWVVDTFVAVGFGKLEDWFGQERHYKKVATVVRTSSGCIGADHKDSSFLDHRSYYSFLLS
jgi:hypothetical protein